MVDQIVRSAANRVRISRLTVIDLLSVFAIKVRTQFITPDDAWVFRRQFREDLVTHKFELFAVRKTEFAMAERLIELYAFRLRLRTLDALQIAVALYLKDQALVDYFVASDKIMCEVAALVGFSVINPEL